jgi:hypothetical protein
MERNSTKYQPRLAAFLQLLNQAGYEIWHFRCDCLRSGTNGGNEKMVEAGD